MTNITNGPGILPIRLGNARLQKSEHTLVHYFDLDLIKTEYDRLNNYFQLAVDYTHRDKDLAYELVNYGKIIKKN